MDGLLLNTEELYTIAISNVLKRFEKPALAWDFKVQLQGIPTKQASEMVIKHYDLPLKWEELERLNVEEQSSLWHMAGFLPGAAELIQGLKAKGIPIALCTSSTLEKFNSKTAHLKDVFDLFDVIVTGDDKRILPNRGKPLPDIWELGLKLLNEKFNTKYLPEQCLVFEDGIAGVKAGKAFGGYVIWVPHPEAIPHLGNPDDLLEGRGEMLSSLGELEKSKFAL
ncbi:HGL075Wp [Eremothecium sinecaudum]|uniref:HGL075Wp n=1 Tax=Eremothecium sinecaudum TaxID=45286 RepID=A0A0X8HVQ0_9SACH|nr:HGL075Wp [Eremothecium sinecaudum]AMD22265.1 HGL075Wp [Eremothecium sinecaudum]